MRNDTAGQLFWAGGKLISFLVINKYKSEKSYARKSHSNCISSKNSL